MKNQYYLKDKKAQLYRPVSVGTNGGMYTTYYVMSTPAPIWCYATQLSQSLVWEARGQGSDETRMFVFNAGTDVALYDFIHYRNEWYRATRVDTQDDYNGDVFVYVEDAPLGNIPKDADLKPYGWEPTDE